MIRRLRQVLLVGLSAFSVLAAARARADIPADYTGTPYKGTPSAIPGRVDLVNVDLGGAEISYHADHNRMNSAGYEPISGNDYRPDEKDLPNICKTNEANPDTWVVDGTTYPSATNKVEYYIGYAHAVDWVKVTVNVAVAGKYDVSSNWASDGAKAGLSIWFNDGHSPVDPKHPKDGVNKSGVVILDGTSDFHKWKAYPKFTTVELAAGLQVMTFHLEQNDHLQYGFLQFDLQGGNPVGTGGAGGAGAGGAPASGAGGTGGADAAAGAPSAGGTGGALVAAGGSATSGAAGASTLPSAGAGGAPAPIDAPASDQSSGCSLTRGSASSWPAGIAALFAACALLRRRRAR